MITLVVFDWNGTLLADTWPTYLVDCELIRKFGDKEPPKTLSDFRAAIRSRVSRFYQQYGVPLEVTLSATSGFRRMFFDLYEPRADKCRTREGSRRVLQFLERRKIPAVILSNHPTLNICRQVLRLGLWDDFHTILGKRPGTGKKKKARLRNFLRNHGFVAGQTLVVDDSVEGLLAASELGAIGVAITGGCFTRSRLMEANPRHVITNMAQLIPIIRSY